MVYLGGLAAEVFADLFALILLLLKLFALSGSLALNWLVYIFNLLGEIIHMSSSFESVEMCLIGA